MTSTTRGDLSDRNSSRVLRPPGGGSSNIFGLSDDEVKPPKNGGANVIEPQIQTQQINASTESNGKGLGVKEEQKSEEAKSELQSGDNSQQRQTISSKHKVGGSGFNPITGEPCGNREMQQPTDSKQNSRIRQPPGGASTKLW